MAVDECVYLSEGYAKGCRVADEKVSALGVSPDDILMMERLSDSGLVPSMSLVWTDLLHDADGNEVINAYGKYGSFPCSAELLSAICEVASFGMMEEPASLGKWMEACSGYREHGKMILDSKADYSGAPACAEAMSALCDLDTIWKHALASAGDGIARLHMISMYSYPDAMTGELLEKYPEAFESPLNMFLGRLGMSWKDLLSSLQHPYRERFSDLACELSGTGLAHMVAARMSGVPIDDIV